jgi:serine-type D-Ala-D-Ala carboxypeptidase/endopeptidase (penicillin-binding protein 4)
MTYRFRPQILVPFGLLALLGGAAAQAPVAGVSPAVEGQPAPAAAPSPAPLSPEVVELRRTLEAIIGNANWRSARWGVMAVSLDRGDTLFAHNADLPLAPASNMKLFSTAAALYYLGPDFRFSTFALVDGPVENGVLDGDVILYGTGDPAISTRLIGSSRAPLQELADSLLAHGIREVRGAVVGDGSYFDDAYLGEGWRPEYRLASYSAPVGALSYAENMVSIRVLPGAAAGQPARIGTVPGTSGFAVRNEVRTVASGPTRVRFDHGDGVVVLSGQIARNHGGVSRSIPVVDPTNYAAAAFRSVLEDRGIRVHGPVRAVSSPEHSRVGVRASGRDNGRPPPRVLGVHLSPPLLEIVNITNQISNNLYAEALLKTVGRVVLGDGSAAGGARAVQFMLECESTFDPEWLRIVDGSGLSRFSRVTARSTVHLLDFMARSTLHEQFLSTLPEAAAPGNLRHSLRNRLGATDAARNLRAKTGTISNVSSLSGYVTAANGERIAFAIYANEVPSTAIAKRMEDGIGIRLAQFRRAAPVQAPPADGPLAAAEAGAAGSSPASPEAAPPPATAAPPVEEALATAPATPAPRAARQPSGPPAAAPRTHTVRPGDTFDAIARRHGTSVRELERANPGVNPRRIQPGQRVRLPG